MRRARTPPLTARIARSRTAPCLRPDVVFRSCSTGAGRTSTKSPAGSSANDALEPDSRPVAEVEAHIQQVVDDRVAPNVRADGGDVHFEGFEPESGVVTVSLSGACITCSSSTVTLRFMIKNVIMHYVPEVTNVVRLGEEEDDAE